MAVRRAILAILVMTTSAAVEAGSPYKCVHPDGQVSYRQTACPRESTGSEIEIEPPSPEAQEANAADWSTQSQLERLQKMRKPSKPAPPKRAGVPRARPTEVWEATLDHRVIRGMDMAEVRESLGAPSSVYTTSDGYVSWDYSVFGAFGFYKNLTLYFRDGLVDRTTNYATR